MAVSRSANSHSVDYDLAWQGVGWSKTVTSPTVDYAHVEMMNKQTMDTVSEEAIYSKQKLVWDDENGVTKQPSLDVQTKMKYSRMAENNHKKVATREIKRVEIADSETLVEAPYSAVVIVDQKQQVQKVGLKKADDNIYRKVKINDKTQQNKNSQGKCGKPVESIISVDDSNCMNKATETNVQALDKLAMIKKSQDKTPAKTSTSQGTTHESHHCIRFKIDKANIMADENATVSMGNHRLKRKL